MTSREKFEAWAAREGEFDQEDLQMDGDEYASCLAEAAWDGWQACALLPDGGKGEAVASDIRMVNMGDLVEFHHPQYGGGFFATEDCFTAPQAECAPPMTADERAAVQFYALNPSAAVLDFAKRIATPIAPQAECAPRALIYDVIGIAAKHIQTGYLHEFTKEVRALLDAHGAQAECGKSSGDAPEPGMIASAKTIAAVADAHKALEFAGDRVTLHVRYAIKCLMDELGQARSAAPQHSADIDAMRHLREEISAINCRYHGSPSYDHDAYWFKEKALAAIDAALQAKGVAT